MPFFLSYLISTPKPSREYKFRSFKKFDSLLANTHLRNLISLMPPLNDQTDLEVYLQSIYSVLFSTLDKFAPFIVMKRRNISPWLDSHTRALMKTRDKLTLLAVRQTPPHRSSLLKN